MRLNFLLLLFFLSVLGCSKEVAGITRINKEVPQIKKLKFISGSMKNKDKIFHIDKKFTGEDFELYGFYSDGSKKSLKVEKKNIYLLNREAKKTTIIISVDGIEFPIDIQLYTVIEDYKVSFFDKKAEIIEYIGKEKDIEVPSLFNGKKLAHIGKDAFANKGLEKLILPNIPLSIGENSFANNNIRELSLPDNTMQIARRAFKMNKISKLNISNDSQLFNIGSEAFLFNDLTCIKLPRLTSIYQDSFDEEVEIIKY